MGLFDEAKVKLAEAVDQNNDKIVAGIDKAATTINEKTENKHADKVTTGATKIKEALERFENRRGGPHDPRDPGT